jgi:hypothetical protein
MLQIVNMEVLAYISSLEEIPQERVISLPNVERFTLVVGNVVPGHEMAAHIHCPSARVTSIVLKSRINRVPGEIFPPSVFCDAIVHQYTRVPAEEATLEIRPGGPAPLTCNITFGSPDSTTISFGYREIPVSVEELGGDGIGWWIPEIFAQAARTIRNYPQLANVKRLHICHTFRPAFIDDSRFAIEVGQLFSSLGPLDEVTIYHCDLQPYLPLFRKGVNERLVLFPSTKKLTLSHPINLSEYETEVVVLAKLQHARGMPFERIVIRSVEMLKDLEEGLKPWVGGVEYCCERLRGEPEEWGLR